MFTWICPKCGAEVPPSYSECPKCGGQGAIPPAEAPPAAEAPAAAPAAPAAPPRKAPLPGWLLAVVFSGVFVALLAGGFLIYQEIQARRAAPPRQAAAFQPPSLPSPEQVKAHRLAAHIEVTGLRLTEDAKQNAFVQFVVVNHWPAEVADLGATVNLKAVSMKGEQQPVGTFSFKIPLIGPYESRDLKVPLNTKLRVYELPDWQFLRVDVQITSP
jgi:hypothetical protein